MKFWHHSHFTKDPEFPSLGLAWPCNGIRVHPYGLETEITMAQTHQICPLWMYEEVWGGYQPQTWHYGNIFTQQVNLNSQTTLRPTWQLWRNEVAPIWPWDSIPMAQKLCTYLMFMCWEAVWGGYRPQTWCYDIIFTPQVNLNSQIWGQFGWWNDIRVPPYGLETACQWLKHFVCV